MYKGYEAESNVINTTLSEQKQGHKQCLSTKIMKMWATTVTHGP